MFYNFVFRNGVFIKENTILNICLGHIFGHGCYLIPKQWQQVVYPRFSSLWFRSAWHFSIHYNDVIMSSLASQITSLTIVYSTVYSRADQRKHQSSASLAFVWGIHRSPVNSPHKGPVTRKMFPFDDVIMQLSETVFTWHKSIAKKKQCDTQYFTGTGITRLGH